MSKTGPIILIEDDPNDLDAISAAIRSNGIVNPIITFETAVLAMAYLIETSDKPFLILCDIKMNVMNGLEFRDAINDNEFLRRKAIPFVFLTAAVSQQIVDQAYDLTVQGFIEKPNTFDELKEMLRKIIEYWSSCMHPNSF